MPNPGTTDTVNYAQWKSTHSQSGDTEDADHDGLTTLEELPPLDVEVAGRLAEEGGEPLTRRAQGFLALGKMEADEMPDWLAEEA